MDALEIIHGPIPAGDPSMKLFTEEVCNRIPTIVDKGAALPRNGYKRRAVLPTTCKKHPTPLEGIRIVVPVETLVSGFQTAESTIYVTIEVV